MTSPILVRTESPTLRPFQDSDVEEALEYRDRLSFLFDKRACDVPYADAAEHEDQQAGERKIILGPLKLAAQVLLLLAVRADLHDSSYVGDSPQSVSRTNVTGVDRRHEGVRPVL